MDGVNGLMRTMSIGLICVPGVLSKITVTTVFQVTMYFVCMLYTAIALVLAITLTAVTLIDELLTSLMSSSGSLKPKLRPVIQGNIVGAFALLLTANSACVGFFSLSHVQTHVKYSVAAA